MTNFYRKIKPTIFKYGVSDWTNVQYKRPNDCLHSSSDNHLLKQLLVPQSIAALYTPRQHKSIAQC
jgi:hypothetical protein